jgi:hypothetical protein
MLKLFPKNKKLTFQQYVDFCTGESGVFDCDLITYKNSLGDDFVSHVLDPKYPTREHYLREELQIARTAFKVIREIAPDFDLAAYAEA